MSKLIGGLGWSRFSPTGWVTRFTGAAADRMFCP